jgi:hypothetical protein
MAVPSPNTTCDIYRGNSQGPPVGSPDVSGVKITLIERFRNIKPPVEGIPPFGVYSHILYMPPTTDVRDGGATGIDEIYIPNKNGTRFIVVWVARTGQGTALDIKVVYVYRDPAGTVFPTNDL